MMLFLHAVTIFSSHNFCFLQTKIVFIFTITSVSCTDGVGVGLFRKFMCENEWFEPLKSDVSTRTLQQSSINIVIS